MATEHYGASGNFGGHCCACAGVCYHVGGPWYCARHDPQRFQYAPPPTVVVTGTGTNPSNWGTVRLSDTDIERVAKRVVELLIQLDEEKVKDRRHWTRKGKEKRRYDTEADAQQAAERTNGNGFNIPTVAYLCPVCDGWHVGTAPLAEV